MGKVQDFLYVEAIWVVPEKPADLGGKRIWNRGRNIDFVMKMKERHLGKADDDTDIE